MHNAKAYILFNNFDHRQYDEGSQCWKENNDQFCHKIKNVHNRGVCGLLNNGIYFQDVNNIHSLQRNGENEVFEGDNEVFNYSHDHRDNNYQTDENIGQDIYYPKVHDNLYCQSQCLHGKLHDSQVGQSHEHEQRHDLYSKHHGQEKNMQNNVSQREDVIDLQLKTHNNNKYIHINEELACKQYKQGSQDEKLQVPHIIHPSIHMSDMYNQNIQHRINEQQRPTRITQGISHHDTISKQQDVYDNLARKWEYVNESLQGEYVHDCEYDAQKRHSDQRMERYVNTQPSDVYEFVQWYNNNKQDKSYNAQWIKGMPIHEDACEYVHQHSNYVPQLRLHLTQPRHQPAQQHMNALDIRGEEGRFVDYNLQHFAESSEQNVNNYQADDVLGNNENKYNKK